MNNQQNAVPIKKNMTIVSAVSLFPIRIPWRKTNTGESTIIGEFFLDGSTPGLEGASVIFSQSPNGTGIFVTENEHAIFIPATILILNMREARIARVF